MATCQQKEDYQIGIICALHIEAAAVIAALDEIHPKLKMEKDDSNDYTLGQIGKHDIVIACLPAGSTGIGPAATVAINMKRSFSIKFGVMVGVGGGVWSPEADVRLGDVVVSQPKGLHGGVVQWDFGKTEGDGAFHRGGTLDRPPPVLLHALQSLRIYDETDGIDLNETLAIMGTRKPRMAPKFKYQGAENDQLFEAKYEHMAGDTCEGCAKTQIIERPPRDDLAPRIHYGNIASGNQVMKNGERRDQIAKDLGVICFEMEAAGLMNDFPCLVIRGICDYADSHKNKAWQPYAAATAAAFSRVLLGFINEQEVNETPHTHRPLTVLPFGRNSHFVGRKSELNRLIKIFHTDNATQNCQRAALDGLGGVGKTQIALEFAFMLQEISPAHSVFWVQASDTPSFEKSYREIGSKLNISGFDGPEADVKILVKERLSAQDSGKWLMIVDNADELNLFYDIASNSKSLFLSKYLPFNTRGAILFTTRDHRAATKYAAEQVIGIEKMDDNESRELFSCSLQNKQLLNDNTSVIKLLELLVNLPLAIVQAAAYLNENTTTIAQYLQIYEESSDGFIQLLSEDFEDEGRYPEIKNPIITTWLISFNQIRDRDTLAADYLAFISCIKEESIPLVLLPEAPLFDKTKALGTLKGFRFVKEQSRGGLINMHRLVHLAMRNWLNAEGEWTLWNEKTLDRVEAVFPWPEHENRTVWTALLPHAQYIIGSTRDLNVPDRPRCDLFGKLGRCLWMSGNDKTSQEMYQQELELNEKILGGEDLLTLTSMNNLALALCNQGKYDEAEPLFYQTLALREKALGKEHPHTLLSMNNLGGLLYNQGKYDEAEPIYRQTLALREKVLGKEHPDMLVTLNNFATLLEYQGKYNEAEPIYRQTLALREKVLGKEHPDTLTSMSNLTMLLEKQGKRDEAEPIFYQILALRKKVLGEEHPDTLSSMNNLAWLLEKQSKRDESELLYRQTLALQEKVLGKEHPTTFTTMNNLAQVLESQSKYNEAEPIYRQSLALREKALGKEHPDTLNSMNNLALLLYSQGKFDEAEPIYRQALALEEKVIGKEHPDMLSCMNNLALLLNEQGKYDEAEPIYRQSLALEEKVLGKKHPTTHLIMNNLAMLLKNQGKNDEAEELCASYTDCGKSLSDRDNELASRHFRWLSTLSVTSSRTGRGPSIAPWRGNWGAKYRMLGEHLGSGELVSGQREMLGMACLWLQGQVQKRRHNIFQACLMLLVDASSNLSWEFEDG